MKKYAEVFWAPWSDEINAKTCWINTAYLPPIPLLGTAHKSVADAQDNLFKCPAVKGLIKNDFIIRSPFDLTLTFDQKTGTFFTDNFGQSFVDNQIANRSQAGGSMMLSLPPRYVFFSKEDVQMVSMDLPLISSGSTRNIKMIPGKYDISKWCRPVDFTFTVIDPSQPVTLKAEDPLWAVRFYTPNDVPVKMTRFEVTPDLAWNFKSMMAVKNFRPNLPLQKCYELAEGVIQQIRKKF